jgi:hypothetical protein
MGGKLIKLSDRETQTVNTSFFLVFVACLQRSHVFSSVLLFLVKCLLLTALAVQRIYDSERDAGKDITIRYRGSLCVEVVDADGKVLYKK